MDIQNLTQFLEKNNHPRFRSEQICRGVFHDAAESFDEITSLSKDLRAQLTEEVSILPFKVLKVIMSKEKNAIKALFVLNDGKIIESVLIAPKPGNWSACISCQVGCAMACEFCATGKLGLERNLTVDEITSQVLFWKQYLKKENIAGTFANIVYMGMGEPFMNWENVKESIAIFTDEKFFNFPNRGLSVSTSGVVPGIKKFADECPQINLAISLHFADDEKRSKYMPVNTGYDLDKLQESLKYYLEKNNRKIFFEYIMLDQINDTKSDANALIKYLKALGPLQLIHVNLIRYNSIGEDFQPSTVQKVKEFQNILQKGRIQCTIRKSVGDDIHGACGQLAGKKKARS